MAEVKDPQKMYEKMFAHRFTKDDKEYQEYLKKPQDIPPIVDDWRSVNLRYYHRNRDNRYNSGWDRRRDWSYSDSYQPYGERRWSYNNQYRQERPPYQQEWQRRYQPNDQMFYSDQF